jgi:hypothetical protein
MGTLLLTGPTDDPRPNRFAAVHFAEDVFGVEAIFGE